MNKKLILVLVIILLVIIVSIYFYNKNRKNDLKSSVMVVDPVTGRLVHLDCTHQINCGYCKKVGIDCPKKA